MKRCPGALYSEVVLCGCKFQFRHVFEPTFTAYGVFFCAINSAKSVRRYNSNMHLHYSAVNSWLTIPTLPQSDDNLGKVEAISVLNARDGNGDAQNAGMPKTLWHRLKRDWEPCRRFWRVSILGHTVPDTYSTVCSMLLQSSNVPWDSRCS